MSRRAVVAVLMLTLTSLAVLALTLNPRWISLFPAPTKPAVNASNAGNASGVNASTSPSPGGNVTVRLVAVPDGAVLVNGSRLTVPATLSVARCSVLNVTQASWPGWEALNGTLLVRACRDTTLRLAWRRIYATVRFEGEGPFQLDGKNMTAPVAVKLPLYTLHNLTQLPYRRAAGSYVPLNGSVKLRVTGNLTVRLAWRMVCGGVLVRSDGPAVEVVSGGAKYRTPVCLPSPATLEAPLEVPINATHSWWLAWYWVGFRGGGGHWWSPTLNGSKLEVSGRPVVTLHYYVGMRGLRYVQAIVKWPPPYFNGSCPLNPGKAVEDIEVKNGWVHVYNGRICVWEGENTRVASLFVTLRFPGEVGRVVFEVWVPEWDGEKTYGSATVEYFFERGGTRIYHVYEPQVDCGNCRPEGRLTIYMDGGRTSVHPLDGFRVNYVLGVFNMYGFAEDWRNRFFSLPPGNSKYLYVDVGSYKPIIHEFYVRVVGVAP